MNVRNENECPNWKSIERINIESFSSAILVVCFFLLFPFENPNSKLSIENMFNMGNLLPQTRNQHYIFSLHTQESTSYALFVNIKPAPPN